MGRYKQTVVYQPQAKTAHIQRVPSYEPPTYADAVMEQQVIHDAFVCQPCSSAGHTDDLNEQQYHDDDDEFIGGDDRSMDIIYAVGHPGHIDFPMLDNVDMMEVDMVHRENPRHQEERDDMDVDSVGTQTGFIPHPHPSNLPGPSSLPIPQPQAGTRRPIRSMPKRVLADASLIIQPSAVTPPNVAETNANATAPVAVEGPIPSGTPSDDLDEICERLLKLDVSGGPHPLLVIYDDSQIPTVYPVQQEVAPQLSLYPMPSEYRPDGNGYSPHSATGTEIWDDVSGLDCAYFVSSEASAIANPSVAYEANTIATPVAHPTVMASSTLEGPVLDPTTNVPVTADAIPNVEALPIFGTSLGIDEHLTVDGPDTVDCLPPTTTCPASEQSLFDFFGLPDFGSEEVFNVVPYEQPFVLIKNASEDNQGERLDRNDAATTDFLPNNSTSPSPRHTQDEFKHDERPSTTHLEEPSSSFTDFYPQVSVQPSISKVPERITEPPSSPPPEYSYSASFCPPPPQPPKRIIRTIWDEDRWFRPVPQISGSKPCPPEPPIVEKTIPIGVSETPFPGDFYLAETEIWPSPGTDYLSWFQKCLLGW